MGNTVWVRVGDQDDYHSYDSILDAGEGIAEGLGDYEPGQPSYMQSNITLVERYIGPVLKGVNLFGTPFVSDNGVSVFWGDLDAQLVRELTDEEIEELAFSIRQYDRS